MKKETKDILRILAIGFAVMSALPVAYRIWAHYNPPPQRRPFSDVLREAGGNRRETLLAMPPDKWLESDRKLAPDIHDWLMAHSDVILPWEWSEEARKKDWQGYCDSWRRIIDEKSDVLEELVDKKTADMEDAAASATMERRIATNDMEQATNLLAIARSLHSAGTNKYPVSLAVVEIVRGRLWGWNQHKKDIRFDNEESLVAFAGKLRDRARREWLDAAETHERKRDEAKANIEELKKAKDAMATAREMITTAYTDGYTAGMAARDLQKKLGESIAVAHRHRSQEPNGLHKWMPDRIRRWLDSSQQDGNRNDADAGKNN